MSNDLSLSAGSVGDSAGSVGSESPTELLRVSGLQKHYLDKPGLLDRLFDTDTERVRAVDDVSFSIDRGETLGVVGESGCGKSTLARTLLGLHEPTAGRVELVGRDVHEWIQTNRKGFTRQAQFVFQDPSSCLDPRLTLREIIREPLEIHNIGATDHQNGIVEELVEKVGLSVDQLDRYPGELSGGQRQRVGIARALGLDPQLLILDEPTSALDVSVQAQILNLLKEIQIEFDLTFLLISHDLSVIRYLCDRVAVMYLGEIVEIGPTEDVFEQTRHPYTQALLESVPQVGAFDIEYEEIDPDIPSPRNPPAGCRFHTRCPDVIPPAEYDLPQQQWLSIFEYKLDIQSGRLTAEKLADMADRNALDMDDKKALATFLRASYGIPDSLRDPTAQSHLDASVRALIPGETDTARECIVEHFVSPCESEQPAVTAIAPTHEVHCHLLERSTE